MTSKVNFSRINQEAMTHLDAVLMRLLPTGVIRQREYISRNPTRNDRNPGSFSISLTKGCWKDFATGDSGSDPVSLVAYLYNLSQVEAAKRLAEMLGIADGEVV